MLLWNQYLLFGFNISISPDPINRNLRYIVLFLFGIMIECMYKYIQGIKSAGPVLRMLFRFRIKIRFKSKLSFTMACF